MQYSNTQVILKKRPVGYPQIGDFEIIDTEINELNFGEVIVEIKLIILIGPANIIFFSKHKSKISSDFSRILK